MTERGTLETLETMLVAEQWALRKRKATAQARNEEVEASRKILEEREGLRNTAAGLAKQAEQRIRALEEAIGALRDRL